MNWYGLFESLLERLGTKLGISKVRLEKIFRIVFWVYLTFCAAYGFTFYSAPDALLPSKIFNSVIWIVGGALLYWSLMLALALSFKLSKLALKILLSGTGLAIIWYFIKRNIS